MLYSGNMKFSMITISIICSLFSNAQDSLVKPSPLQGLSISGNYRFYGQHRFLTDPYAFEIANGDPVYLEGRNILIGDATQLPELTLNISGRPNSKTSFGTDLIVWNQMTGDFDYYRNLQLGINLYGNFSTDFGNVGIRAGGIHWHQMTPFTMRSFAGFNRYSLFERNPWDPQFKNVDERYSQYYKLGAISQDTRWAQQAFQGLIMDVTELPLGISLSLIYGKTQNAGSAFATANSIPEDSSSVTFLGLLENTIPNNVYGGQFTKVFGKHSIGLNSFNRYSYSDLLAQDEIHNSVHTTTFNFMFNKIEITGEAGIGQYRDVYQDLGIGELISTKIKLTEKLIRKLPMEIHLYRIASNVVNNNSEFVNTSVVEVPSAAASSQQVIGSNGVLQQTGSAMLGVGQMANNRQGLNLNSDFKIKIGSNHIKGVIGMGISQEIENLNNQITYGHAINGLTMSRLWRWSFPSNVGPYNRLSVLYRGIFETVNLTDLDASGSVINDKHFNNIETQLKYEFKLFNRPFYMFYLGMYNSVQPNFSPITVFTEDAYIRYYAHQFENYYRIHPKLVLAQYLGLERVIGNYSTQVEIESNRPLNQNGLAIGFGLDYILAKNTMLYLRHRYFKFEDTSYALSKFAGNESTIELKINF